MLPLLSLNTFTIQAIGYSLRSCLSNTMSPTWQFRFWLFYFSLFCRVSRTSFLHLPQNSLATSCTLFHCFLEYRPEVVKLPGAGITSLDFIVRRLMGLNGAKLVTSFITSVVSDLEFWQMPQLHQPEFAMILQSSHFHKSLVMNSGLIKHFLFVATKLLPYYLQVVDFFSTPCNHHHFLLRNLTNFLVIHFLKVTYRFYWCTRKICSIVRPDHPYYSSSLYETS